MEPSKPLAHLKHSRSCSQVNISGVDKESAAPAASRANGHLKSLSTVASFDSAKAGQNFRSLSDGKVLKESSLQYCMQANEPDKSFGFGTRLWDLNPVESHNSYSSDIWDYSDSEAALASSWSTLPNRALLCRPLPLDVGRCICVIVRESSRQDKRSPAKGSLYSLYTNEGKGRQDRKLAVAYHKRRNGRSQFIILQNKKGIQSVSDDSYLGVMKSNLVGSKYQIWDQGGNKKPPTKQSNKLLGILSFKPTISTWLGSYRSMKAYVPKHQSVQLKNSAQVQHINGLPIDWEVKMDKVHQLFSKPPHYNNVSKQYELDYRDRGRAGLKTRRSVKNFQLTQEKNGKQTILQLGKVEKHKYVMDFRYPLTGYQAFCMCLAFFHRLEALLRNIASFHTGSHFSYRSTSEQRPCLHRFAISGFQVQKLGYSTVRNP